jgi:hypothetical protein
MAAQIGRDGLRALCDELNTNLANAGWPERHDLIQIDGVLTMTHARLQRHSSILPPRCYGDHRG